MHYFIINIYVHSDAIPIYYSNIQFHTNSMLKEEKNNMFIVFSYIQNAQESFIVKIILLILILSKIILLI